MKLYELTGQYRELIDSLTQAVDEGKNVEWLAEKAASLEGDIRDKIENCVKIARVMDAHAAAYKREEVHYGKRAKSADTASKKLEQYIQWCMETAGMDKVEGDNFKVSLCNNGVPALDVTNPDKVPRRFFIKQEPKRDDKAIKEALLSGKKLSFARLDYGKHIRIS